MAKIKKLPSTFLNMVLVLTAISLVSAFALGYTYSKTRDAIAQVKIDKMKEALQDVLPAFDNEIDKEASTNYGPQGFQLFPARAKGKFVGAAVKAYSDKGFGGRIWLMAGFDQKLNLINIKVLEHLETPGLGSKMALPSFIAPFQGRDLRAFKASVKKDGGEVDAITAATITSRAFCDAVAQAHQAFLGYYKDKIDPSADVSAVSSATAHTE